MGEKEKEKDEIEKKRRPLPKDRDEELLEPIEKAVKDFWELSWQEPKAEKYKLLDYLNICLLGKTFINFIYNISEGEFGVIRYLPTAPEVKIGILATSYGGIEGLVGEKTEIRRIGEEIPKSVMNNKLYGILNPEKGGFLEKVRTKGREIFREYIKRPEEKVPIVYEKGKTETFSKYFYLVEDPWKYTQMLMEMPERMLSYWTKRLGRELIKNASVQLNYKNEFGLTMTKTKEAEIKGVQKEIRLTLEGILDVEKVGEVGEAIGCAGGLEALEFTHPYTFHKYKGWEAIEGMGEWVGEKASLLMDAEKVEDVIKETKVNVIMPGSLLAAAMSYFLSGRKMWEAIKGEKKFQPHRLIGSKIAPPDFTMKIDGRQETAWGKDLYGSLEIDSEGTPATEKTLIESGKLVRFLNSRLYFVPIAERTVLAKDLLAEENPLTATARKEYAQELPHTVPTNLYVEPSTELSIDGLVEKLGKQQVHLYVASASLAGVNLDEGSITIKVELSNPIQGGKIIKERSIAPFSLNLKFDAIPEKLKYIGGPSTLTTHSFNLEMDGSVYEVSVTAPYIALFEVERSYKRWDLAETEDLFTSQHLYTQALPKYLGTKGRYLRIESREPMPEKLKSIGIIYPPFVPAEYVRGKRELLKYRIEL